MNRTIEHLGKKYIPFSLRLALRKLNWQLSYLRQSPDPQGAVQCPITKKTFKSFLVRSAKRKVSPDTGAFERHRLIWLYLERETNFFTTPNKVLHIGPEYCFYVMLKDRDGIEYYPADKTEKGYGYQQDVHYLDLTEPSLADNTFDFILCNHVLEHIPDDRLAIKEMLRMLKPGGSAIITVPMVLKDIHFTYEDPSITDPKEREKHFRQWDHQRLYGLDLVERLKEQGFEAKALQYAAGFNAEEQRRFGLGDDYLFIARKPA